MADFQSRIGDFIAEGINVMAGSIDPPDKAEETAKKLGITFPMAYGMDAEAASKILGAFYEKEKKFIQPTGFIVRPNKTVEVAVYSSGPVGRFVAKDVLSLIKFYKSRQKK